MGKKILLADDSITIQKVISITFATEDYELIIAGDGDTAITKIRESKPDIVMADVAMPGKTGYEVCEAVKKDPALSKTPVLLLAGTFEPLNKSEAARVNADDSIIKPFESQELIDKVNALLERAAASRAPKAAVEDAVAGASIMPEPKLEISEDIWEAGDFLGLPEDFERPKEGEKAPDLSFLEAGLFEGSQKELSLPDEREFMDLELQEEDLKPEKPSAPPASPSSVEGFKKAGPAKAEGHEEPFMAEHLEKIFESSKAEPFEVEPFDVESFRPEPRKPEPFEFETIKEEPRKPEFLEAERFREEPNRPEPFETGPPRAEAKAGPFEVEPFEVEPFKPEELEGVSDAKPFWAEGSRPEVEMAESEKAEAGPVSQEAIEEGPTQIEFVGEPVKEEAWPYEPPRLNLQVPEIKSAGPQAVNLTEAGRAPAGRIIEEVADRAGVKIQEDVSAKLDPRIGSPLGKEETAEIVRKAAREVIQEIAWEVVPEIAEELIKAEINKFKEMISRLK